MAVALGVAARNALGEAITEAAVEQVHRWLDTLDLATPTLDEVHTLVLNQTRLCIEQVESDEDLQRVGASYQRDIKTLPAQLEFEFHDQTEALVFRRQSADRGSASQYVAIVDARGDRSQRAWFAKRHESTHLLIKDPGAHVLVRRTRVERPEPLEQVVDAVASRIGFWEPTVVPVLEQALRRHRHALEAFEEARLMVAPEASLESSYRAFARLMEEPLILIWSAFAARKGEAIVDGVLPPSWALRARTIIWNEAAARAGIQVWRNFRIPSHSVIAAAHEDALCVLSQIDDLGRWVTEGGVSLSPVRVLVTAKGAWSMIQLAG